MDKKHIRVWKQLQALESNIFGYIKDSVEDAEIARDLCQDVFIQALQKIDKLNPDAGLYSWLRTVSRNRVINYYRERRRRTYVEITESTIRTELRTENLGRTIEEVIRQLPPDQREVFALREIEGFSYRELSRHLQRSEAAISSLLKRARLRFTRLYLLHHLPDWFRRSSDDLSIEDIGRFINAFDPPLDLLEEIQERSQRYFESIRRNWNQIHETLFPRIYLEQIFTHLGGGNDKRVLDLGCGSGVVSARISAIGKSVTGVDINKGMLDELSLIRNGFGYRNLNLVRANINRLPFGDVRFDEVFMTLVLHHVSDPKLLLREAIRLVETNGHLVLVEFDRHTNRQLADTMHDLWMGFDPRLIEKWCGREGMKLNASETWQAGENVRAYYLILEKGDH